MTFLPVFSFSRGWLNPPKSLRERTIDNADWERWRILSVRLRGVGGGRVFSRSIWSLDVSVESAEEELVDPGEDAELVVL